MRRKTFVIPAPPIPICHYIPPSFIYRIDLCRRVKSISTGQSANLYGSIKVYLYGFAQLPVLVHLRSMRKPLNPSKR